jgi:hypothetical protein
MTGALGTCTVMYDQAGSDTYNPAPQVTETVDAAAAFGGFKAPGPTSGLNRPGETVKVKLTLTNASGTPLPGAMAADLGSGGDVEVVLSGPNGSTTQLASALCSWLAKGGYFQCGLDIPLGLTTGRNSQYELTAYQKVGGGFTLVPPFTNTASDANPETIQLKPPKLLGLGRKHIHRRVAAHKRAAARRKAKQK